MGVLARGECFVEDEVRVLGISITKNGFEGGNGSLFLECFVWRTT